MRCSLLVCQIFLAGLYIVPVWAQQAPKQRTVTYLSLEEALHEAFPEAHHFAQDTFRLSPEQIQQARQRLHVRQMDSLYVIHLAYDSTGALLGYALVLNEVGKYEPITFLVAITPELRVKQVAIMVYRENRGGEIRMPRFLYQYRDKTLADPIRTRRDIINISGATLSVRAVNRGVRKALFVLNAYTHS